MPDFWFVHWPHLLPAETYESLSNFPVGGSDPFAKLNPEGGFFFRPWFIFYSGILTPLKAL